MSKQLLRVLHANADTAFGREHGFARIADAREYARAVPVRSYEDFAPYIERIANGERAVLTCEPVRRFVPTSGTTSASKLIPYTDGLLREFRRGIAPWLIRLFREHPRLLPTSTYWSITPVDATRRTTPAGIPIGFDDDRAYVGPVARAVLHRLMPVPSAVARIDDIDVFRYATLRLLLQQRDLGWLSVWSPSFLTLLLAPLAEWRERLLDDLAHGTIDADVPPAVRAAARAQPQRARELRDARTPTELWPRLRLISCWAHGSAAALVDGVKQLFPNATIQPKGLLATEAFVSYPYRDDLSALALASHFFEFVDPETGHVSLAHELERGRTYSVLVTTSGGLYRYRLGDLVEIGGFAGARPLLRFVGKEDDVSDLHGEKLDERFVRVCGEELFAAHAPTFWLLAPENGTRYTLYVQGIPATEDLAAQLDRLLRRNYHYDYCRRLGQLERCDVRAIPPQLDANAVFLAARVERGQRLGEVKPAVLDRDSGWTERFGVIDCRAWPTLSPGS